MPQLSAHMLPHAKSKTWCSQINNKVKKKKKTYFYYHLPLLLSESEVKVTPSCPTLCDPMDSTAHGILQARILEWVAFPFSRGASQPRYWTQVSCIAGGCFTSWATREALLCQSFLCKSLWPEFSPTLSSYQGVKDTDVTSAKEPACQCRRHYITTPGPGRTPEEGNGSPLQCSCLKNPLDRRASWATVCGVTKGQTALSVWAM